jgi:hypothetical protein
VVNIWGAISRRHACKWIDVRRHSESNSQTVT